MGKLILKTASVTLLCLVAVALILFGAVSLISPSAMMGLTDSLAMEGMSAYYSVAVYERTGAVGDLASAVERSFDAEHFDDAAKYGKLLLTSEGFSDYCAERDADTQGIDSVLGEYAQYAAGLVSSAQYYIGEKDSAIETALGAVGETFPQNNAAVYLATAAMDREDKDFCRQMLGSLEELNFSGTQDQARLSDFVVMLKGYCAA